MTAAELQLRFKQLLLHHEAAGPDCTVPGASKAGRWAVLTESNRGHGLFLNRADSRADAERVAAANIAEGWEPVCLYDLSALAGDEPPIECGDIVRVVDPGAAQHSGAGPLEVVDVDSKDGERTLGFENGTWCWAYEAEVVEREAPDRRLPLRYDLARVLTIVIFNTEAST